MKSFLTIAALDPALKHQALEVGYQLLMLCAEPITVIDKYVVYRLGDLKKKKLLPTPPHSSLSFPEGIHCGLENIITSLTPELLSTHIIIFPIHPSQNALGPHSKYHEFELWGQKELIEQGYFKRLKL